MKNFKYYCSNDNFLPARKLFADGNVGRNDIYLLSYAMENGSFSYDLGKYNLTKDEIENNLNKYFQLDSNHSFKKIKEEQDELGFTHINYMQLYKNELPIDGAIVMLHLKNGIGNSINGSVSTIKDFEINPILSGDDAIYIAEGDDNPTKCRNYKLLIDFQNGFNRLAYKVDCDDTVKYIDALTGDLFKSISTVYTATSGEQSIDYYTDNKYYQECLLSRQEGTSDEDLIGHCEKYANTKDREDATKEYVKNNHQVYTGSGGGAESDNKSQDAVTPKVDINVNTIIFGAIGGGVGYLVAKNLIKTDKVLIPMLIGAAAFAYYQIQNKK